MKNAKFYIAYGKEGQIYRVKKEGCQEEYDGFRLNGYKERKRWSIVEDYTGINCLKKPIKNKKEAFEQALTNLNLLARKEEKIIPEYVSRFRNVYSYKELK